MRRVIGALALVLLACACTKPAPTIKPGTLPPSGYYDLHFEVTSWDCASTKPAPFTAKRATIETTRDGGGTILHAPVWPEQRPDGHLVADGMTDLALRRGEKRKTEEQEVWNCGERMVDTFESEVTELSHDQLRLKVTRTYGDMSICKQPRAREESRCRAEALVTLTLVESKCELPWTGREQFTKSGTTEMVCYHAL
jgi:hypothetical protein